MTTINKPALAKAEQAVARTAVQRTKLFDRLTHLNSEIAYLRSQMENSLQHAIESDAQPDTSLQESLNNRYEEKKTVEAELQKLEDEFISELSGMKEELRHERLAVMRAGKDKQESLATELKRDKVAYLKKIMLLNELSEKAHEEANAFNEVGRYVNMTPIPLSETEMYPYPVPNGQVGFSPYVTPGELGVAYEGSLPFEARQYQENYMNKPYGRGY